MKRGHILNPNLSPADRAMIEEILRSSGVSMVDYDPSIIDQLDPSVDIGIIALPIEDGSEKIVSERIGAIVARGIRVVSIWLRRSESGLPSIIADCGSSVVAAGSSNMTQALTGEGGEVWELSSGEERPVQPTPRNRC